LARNGSSMWVWCLVQALVSSWNIEHWSNSIKSAYSFSNSSWFHKMSKNHSYLAIIFISSGIHLSWPSSAVWVTDARCHIALTLLSRTHQHILVIDVWPLIDTLARAAGSCRLWDPAYVAHHYEQSTMSENWSVIYIYIMLHQIIFIE